MPTTAPDAPESAPAEPTIHGPVPQAAQGVDRLTALDQELCELYRGQLHLDLELGVSDPDQVVAMVRSLRAQVDLIRTDSPQDRAAWAELSRLTGAQSATDLVERIRALRSAVAEAGGA